MAAELVLNLGSDAALEPAFVQRASDPIISPTYATPGDFAAQYPTPLDTTEIVVMCEEINMWRSLPELATSLQAESWRELNTLAFTSGSLYVTFADGACPEEFYHSGANQTVNLKNLGAKKSLSISDIMHSQAVAAADWNGINRILGGWSAGEGLPGGTDVSTFLAEGVADLKAKEMLLASTLVLNQWDRLLVNGNATNNALEFNGMETSLLTNGVANGVHMRSAYDVQQSGTFASDAFDRFLSESCAKATTVFGHPTAIQEMMSAYLSRAFQGSQIIQYPVSKDGAQRIIPGINFAGQVNTGIGTLQVVADTHFARTALGAAQFQASLYPVRMTHNGEPLIYKRSQIPLSFRDLVPGCTAIAFEIWAKTALIIKAMCAQGCYNNAVFSGRVVTTCATI